MELPQPDHEQPLQRHTLHKQSDSVVVGPNKLSPLTGTSFHDGRNYETATGYASTIWQRRNSRTSKGLCFWKHWYLFPQTQPTVLTWLSCTSWRTMPQWTKWSPKDEGQIWGSDRVNLDWLLERVNLDQSIHQRCEMWDQVINWQTCWPRERFSLSWTMTTVPRTWRTTKNQ